MTDAQMDHVRALHLIRAFQVRGHEMCNLDPLGVHEPEAVPELDYKTYVRLHMLCSHCIAVLSLSLSLSLSSCLVGVSGLY